MGKRISLLFCLFTLLFSGCSTRDFVAEQLSSGVAPFVEPTVQFTTMSTQRNELELESTEVVDNCMHDDNPYAGYAGAYDAWRYPVYEIFRDAEAVSFEEAIHYKRSYMYLFSSEHEYYPNYVNTFECEVTLPQAIHSEPWVEQINAYYQDILNNYIEEGEEFWSENFDIWWHYYGITYYYEGAYRIGNVLTIMRSGYHDIGSRPDLGWVPFADLFSAIDGRPLMLDDLFKVEREEYLPILHASLLKARDCFKEGYQPDPEWEDWFWSQHSTDRINYFDWASAAVTPASLVFIYPPGFASSNASGVVFLDVPYTDLHGLLSPVYFPDHGT